MNEILKTFDLTPLDSQMILICVVLFFLFWKIVANLLFKPYLQLIEEREALTEGANIQAEDILKRVEELKIAYEEKIMNARIEAVKEKLNKIKEAKERAGEIIKNAESEAQDYIKREREEIEHHIEDLRASLTDDVDKLAEELAGKLLTIDNYKVTTYKVN